MTNPKQTILIDTCVLLEDPDVINRIRGRDGIPFLTGTVLDELDYNKKGDERINRNAREIFRELNSEPTLKPLTMPTGEPLIAGDLLTRFPFGGGSVFLINRDTFRSNTNNDGKIIELAKDYGMLLLTRDGGMKVRADALGVRVVLWTGPQSPGNTTAGATKHSNTRKLVSQRVDVQGTQPFALPTSPITEKDQPTPVTKLPKTGETVKTISGRSIILGSLMSAGGEGSIYQTPNHAEVCKIYHSDKLTAQRRKKIELMVSRKIHRPGICWPTDIVLNDKGLFVGFLMPRATGKTVQTTMFVKPVLLKTFPRWRRQDLLNICIAFLEHIRFLHSLNIIVGDINPMNLLVMEDSNNLWMVDADSFQIENFPCAVGTVNFTAPEIQGRNYTDYLRTKEHELFAVATMLFMLLHPGKPPYSQQGGGSPVDNIKAMDFPYWFRTDDEEFSGKNAPQGPWQYVWANLPYHVKEAFHKTFRKNSRPSIDDWLRVCRRYQVMLAGDQTSSELFPASFRIRDPIEVSCGRCNKNHKASKQWVDKLQLQGKQAWCPECNDRFKLERLANQSLRDTRQAEQKNQPPKPGQSPYQRPSQSSWSNPPRNTSQSGRPRTSSSNRGYSSPQKTSAPSSGDGLIVSILKFLFK